MRIRCDRTVARNATVSFIPQLRDPLDVCHHATSEIATGSKLGVDVMKKLPGEGFRTSLAAAVQDGRRGKATTKSRRLSVFANLLHSVASPSIPFDFRFITVVKRSHPSTTREDVESFTGFQVRFHAGKHARPTPGNFFRHGRPGLEVAVSYREAHHVFNRFDFECDA